MEDSMLFLDGGMGTTLEDQHKVVFSADTPLWSSHLLVTDPSILKRVHTDFVEAGANIVLTATYQASFEGFSRTKVNNAQTISRADAERYLLSSVALARSSFGSHPGGLVALSLGAYGATMLPSTEYTGAYGAMTESDLISFHRDRLSVFLKHDETWANVDTLAFETLPRLNEIRAVRAVVSGIPPAQRKPYWIACVFPGSEDRLPDGTTIKELVDALLSQEDGHPLPYAIGINCTRLSKISSLVRQLEKSISDAGYTFPGLVLYPDGTTNEVYDTKQQRWIQTPNNDAAGQSDRKEWDEEMFDIMRDIKGRNMWRNILVGGCCKTTPLHIARLRRRWESASD